MPELPTNPARDLLPPGTRVGVDTGGTFTDLVLAFRKGSRAAKNGFDARLQFIHGKGLRHVVVGAHFEPL